MASLAQPIAASKSTTAASTNAAAPIVFTGRFLFALIFLMAGSSHFLPQTIGYAASQGVPLAPIVVPLSGVVAFLGALSILVGYRAKIGAWLIVLFLIGVTPLHKFWGISDPMMQQMQMAHFMKNLAMLGGALLVSQFGAGPWSLDNRSPEKHGK
jgi:putative oxidoreductase